MRSRVVSLLVLALFSWSLASAQSTQIRIVAANLTSGNDQSYDPGHGIRILKALKPDVVMIQEFRYTRGPVAQMVKEIVGPSSYFYREDGYELPNGVLSRWPIKEAGSWKDPHIGNRGLTWARIDIPGDRDLWAVSLHLKAGGDSKQVRMQEAEVLVGLVKKKVPQGDYMTVGGDFNTSDRTEPCLRELSEVVETAAPYPVDQSGKSGTSANRGKPYDWVLANGDLDAKAVVTKVGAKSFPDGLVFDSRVSPSLFSAGEVQADDSASANMQHMAVVRDFAVPAAGQARQSQQRAKARAKR
ncbi:MAG: endonuclease/exonuclease/phosphatase family protein [Candidatus Riflebacteria bacterium]|nr:endonuclease/exonuclease/phosphatase family protein [Candidatus Riflebacteria bacterium]